MNVVVVVKTEGEASLCKLRGSKYSRADRQVQRGTFTDKRTEMDEPAVWRIRLTETQSHDQVIWH